uniref:protein-serine/threonine phosphatase n=1 Tax=Ananas comosus var. bracteatus TaxID=296719 RepID=A0A6V7PTF6_ANACO|nr:unnamed protein product [Ananas comosus var. bracteatus]
MENKTRDSDNKKNENKGERAVPVCCGEELEGARAKCPPRRRESRGEARFAAAVVVLVLLLFLVAVVIFVVADLGGVRSGRGGPRRGDPGGGGGGGGGRIGFPSLSHGEVSVIGRRREMEDAVTVALGFAGSPEAAAGYDFFGVYDGHGGARVAQACRDRMHVVLAEEAAKRRRRRRATPVKGEEEMEMEMEMEMAMAMALGDDEEDEELGRWRAAMAASFARVDGEVSEAAEGGGSGAAEKTVGSTAVVAVWGRGASSSPTAATRGRCSPAAASPSPLLGPQA